MNVEPRPVKDPVTGRPKVALTALSRASMTLRLSGLTVTPMSGRVQITKHDQTSVGRCGQRWRPVRTLHLRSVCLVGL